MTDDLSPGFSIERRRCERLLMELYENQTATVEALSRRLSRPPADIHRLLEFLRKSGCGIETTPAGVQLDDISWPWWRAILEDRSGAAGRMLGRHVLVFDQTTSTNDVCWQAARQADERPLVVLADVQTRGRGRRGRRWESKPGQSLLLSILLPAARRNAETLTLTAGLAVAQTIETLVGVSTVVKWPNDVLVDGKKIAGILIETRWANPQEMDSPTALDHALGIGLNVGQQSADFPAPLADRAASLAMISHHPWNRLRVLEALLEQLERNCLHPPALAPLIAAWKARCAMLGQPIRVHCGGMEIVGRVADIDPLEGLVLRDETGAVHLCKARETTVLSP